METFQEGFDIDYIEIQGTGSHGFANEFKILPYKFGKYQIKVKLTHSNEFLGIVEIGIDKDFLSHKQKIISQDFVDVSKDYPEDPPE